MIGRGSWRRLPRELLVAFFSLALVGIYFLLPPNREGARFVLHRLGAFPAEWSLWKERDPEARMRANYRMNYDGPIYIRDHLEPGEILQLPPRAYLSRFFPVGQDGWAEPRFIYYVAGRLWTVSWKGRFDPNATVALVVDSLAAGMTLRIVSLDPPGARDRIEALYRAVRGSRP